MLCIARCECLPGRLYARFFRCPVVLTVLQAVRIDKVITVATGYADVSAHIIQSIPPDGIPDALQPLKAGHWAFPFWVFGSLVLSIALTGIRKRSVS